MRRFTVPGALRASAALVVVACSAAGDETRSSGSGGESGVGASSPTGSSSADGTGGSGNSGIGGSATASGSGGASTGTGTGGTGTSSSSSNTGSGGMNQGGGPACPSGSAIYTLDSNADLYAFDPPSLTFSLIGTLNCPSAFATPFSMAVARDGTAWVVFTDGTLYTVDTMTAACSSTAFVPGQQGFLTFGMGFSANAPNSPDETLFVSESNFDGSTIGLATIDLQTLVLTPVAMYDSLNARAEMTGTGDAQLFGAFEGSPYIVAEIDKTTAQILSQAPQTAINYAPGSSNFAFAFWGGDFWLFVGPGFSTDVFQYKPRHADDHPRQVGAAGDRRRRRIDMRSDAHVRAISYQLSAISVGVDVGSRSGRTRGPDRRSRTAES